MSPACRPAMLSMQTRWAVARPALKTAAYLYRLRRVSVQRPPRRRAVARGRRRRAQDGGRGRLGRVGPRTVRASFHRLVWRTARLGKNFVFEISFFGKPKPKPPTHINTSRVQGKADLSRPLRSSQRRCARAPKMRPFALQPPRPCFGQGDSRGRSDGRLPPGPAGRGSVQSIRNPPPRVAARVSHPARPSSAWGHFARVHVRSEHSRPLSRANGAGLGRHRGPLRGERRGRLRSALP